MAEIVEIDDPGDPRLDDFLRLRDVTLRQRVEHERGVFLAEGEKVVRRAVEAGHDPVSFLMAPRWLDGLSDVLAGTDAPCFVLPEAAIESVTGFHVHRGALAALRRPGPRSPADVLAGARRVVVMEDLADHANVGAIFRSAAALGFDAVLLSPRCADPLYRRAVKVSMGAVFRIPFARVDEWYDAPTAIRAAGLTTWALTVGPDAVPIGEAQPPDRLALVVGSEGHGLSDRWEHTADLRVTIPMAGDIDSLNAAASVAVAAYEVTRRRRES